MSDSDVSRLYIISDRVVDVDLFFVLAFFSVLFAKHLSRYIHKAVDIHGILVTNISSEDFQALQSVVALFYRELLAAIQFF